MESYFLQFFLIRFQIFLNNSFSSFSCKIRGEKDCSKARFYTMNCCLLYFARIIQTINYSTKILAFVVESFKKDSVCPMIWADSIPSFFNRSSSAFASFCGRANTNPPEVCASNSKISKSLNLESFED